MQRRYDHTVYESSLCLNKTKYIRIAMLKMCSIQDISDPKRVFELDKSETKIGRGPFLGVTDKKVSRNHGTLKQFSNGVKIKSIHVNPCFYARKSDKEKWMKLDKNETVVLNVGDIFSLLPKQHIYEVINTSTANIGGNARGVTNPSNKEEHRLSDVDILTKTAGEQVSGMNNQGDPSDVTNDGEKFRIKQSSSKIQSTSSENSFIDGDKEVAFPTTKKRKLPNWMTKKANSPKTPKNKHTPVKNPKTSTAQQRTKMPSVKFESSDSEHEIIDSKENNNNVATERTSKRIKINDALNDTLDKTSENVEMVDVSVNACSMNNSFVKQSENTCVETKDPVTSTETQVGATNSQQSASIAQHSADIAQQSTSIGQRSSCAYGSSCYRKNPQHFQEFSHPSDSDYLDPATGSEDDDDSNRPECPYGTGCYRKNPLHRKQYRHSVRVAPKRVAKIRAARKAKHEGSSSDEYDLDDSFLNDNSDDDVDEGASDDGDSDWNPSLNSQTTKVRTSRRGQTKKKTNYKESDSDLTTDDEDIDDLQ